MFFGRLSERRPASARGNACRAPSGRDDALPHHEADCSSTVTSSERAGRPAMNVGPVLPGVERSDLAGPIRGAWPRRWSPRGWRRPVSCRPLTTARTPCVSSRDRHPRVGAESDADAVLDRLARCCRCGPEVLFRLARVAALRAPALAWAPAACGDAMVGTSQALPLLNSALVSEGFVVGAGANRVDASAERRRDAVVAAGGVPPTLLAEQVGRGRPMAFISSSNICRRARRRCAQDAARGGELVCSRPPARSAGRRPRRQSSAPLQVLVARDRRNSRFRRLTLLAPSPHAPRWPEMAKPAATMVGPAPGRRQSHRGAPSRLWISEPRSRMVRESASSVRRAFVDGDEQASPRCRG